MFYTVGVCVLFSCWECAGEGEVNNLCNGQTAEHGHHTEGRLRIATSLESFHCPKQFFPTENHFCLLLSHKEPHFDCYIAHLAQKCSNLIIPSSFHGIDLPVKTAVGMRNTWCTFNLSLHLSRVRGLLLSEVKANTLS